jgi:hypothetical protein
MIERPTHDRIVCRRLSIVRRVTAKAFSLEASAVMIHHHGIGYDSKQHKHVISNIWIR